MTYVSFVGKHFDSRTILKRLNSRVVFTVVVFKKQQLCTVLPVKTSWIWTHFLYSDWRLYDIVLFLMLMLENN